MTPQKEKTYNFLFDFFFFCHACNRGFPQISNYGFLFAANKIKLFMKYSDVIPIFSA